MEAISEYFPFNFARNIFFDFRKFLTFSHKRCDKFKGEQEIRCMCLCVTGDREEREEEDV